MKNYFAFGFAGILLLFACGVQSEGDVLHVVTHDHVTVVTNPKVGNNSYVQWAVFPDSSLSVRQILMHVTLGKPDSLKTAHWDYRDQITILRVGGQQGESLGLEVGRMLTPYGAEYKEGWEFTWTVDVTDFAQVLRDSVEVEYVHSGYEPVTVGWALTIDFEIIKGSPHITPLKIEKVWNGHFKYGDPKNPIENHLLPFVYSPHAESGLSRLRIQHTGHGMDKPKGCSEFCKRWRNILFDGELVQHRDLWKRCGDNPLYPQAGTWIFDRALWCPGDLQNPDIIDVYTSKEKHCFTMEMEPYVSDQVNQPKEVIGSCLIHYTLPHAAHDVRLEKIITPNRNPQHGRDNPNCFDARIVIRNLGYEDLKSLKIVYGTEGEELKEIEWQGNLPYYAQQEVLLPGVISQKPGENTFVVECSQPNNERDAWIRDNKMKVIFDAPPLLPEKFVVHYRTNMWQHENHLFVVSDKDTLLNKRGADLSPGTLYVDTLVVPAGSYEMTLQDRGGNGLEYWCMPEQGYGYVYLLDMAGRMLHKFERDCGVGETYAFLTTGDYVKDTVGLSDYIVSPKTIQDTLTINIFSEQREDQDVVLILGSTVVERYSYKDFQSGRLTFDVSHLTDGRYTVEVRSGDAVRFRTRIHKKSAGTK